MKLQRLRKDRQSEAKVVRPIFELARPIRSMVNFRRPVSESDAGRVRAGKIRSARKRARGGFGAAINESCQDGKFIFESGGVMREDGSFGLKRGLGLLDATAIVIGSMIGSGIFIVSAESARLVGAPGWLLLAWLLAGVLTITGALCCAELAAMMPQAGGQYVFLREAYHPAIGFLFGWSLFIVIQTGTIAAVAVAFANFLGVFTDTVSPARYVVAPIRVGPYAVSLSTQQLVAIALILLLTWTNTRGLRAGKVVQNLFTFTKTAALIGLIGVGLLFGWNERSAAYTSSWWDPWANGWTPQNAQPGLQAFGALALLMLLGRAMTGPLFAQSAWNNVTFTGSETRDPGRTLPRALLYGCSLVVVLYLLANVAYIVTLPLEGIQRAPQGRVATAAMQAILGTPGQFIMAACIMISTFGCDNGLILAGARVYYAMARDGLFFARIGELNERRVPATALVAQGVWASALTLPRTISFDERTGAVQYGNVYTQLLEYIIAADLIFYVLMVGAVIIMRWRLPHAPRPYRTWGYPFVPLIYIALAVSLVCDLIYLAPATSGIGFLLVMTGLPIYFVKRAALRSVLKNERGEA
ncbi:APC family permease [Pyrinomonas methylaliphatogenes]|uniref:Amino acid/polyamine/organocation transporter, APC superfamily (TC 2.A.3) n=1 Tax=Pyrinomonas methylaliphatogenes TaxID=454194 RepID=A0A0B6X3D4_9BACT|nr:APC family permease [Pyrinomonas methylaliphatogenes]CDM66820.1 amino acid/polyamine/organocation transporter, APC superfamily (TC 2.A.3) [Pyrinomonas methylaliphatogenes]